MPMDFPDMAALKRAADVHGFREPFNNESEEIRNKVGWNKFSDVENMLMLLRARNSH